MTRDDIIRLAQVSGLHTFYGTESIEWFAALIAACEREACAKVAESYEPTCDTCPSGVANAIRARGEV